MPRKYFLGGSRTTILLDETADPESNKVDVVANQIADVLRPLEPGARDTVIGSVLAELDAKANSGVPLNRITSMLNLGLKTPNLKKADRENLLSQQNKLKNNLAKLDELLSAEVNPFIRFCQSVRGFEITPEPGAHMMALGRMFIGKEEAQATALADLLNSIENAAQAVGWERFAPNAKACFEYLRNSCETEQGALESLFARRWARVGFPVVEMGHRTAASLMFTHGSDHIESPWSAFMVKVPDGLVVLEGTNRHACLARVLCLAPSEKITHWDLLLHWRSDDAVDTLHVPMKSLDGELTEPMDWSFINSNGDVGLRRAIEMTGRLIAGACMLTTAKQDITERPWQPKPKSERRRAPGIEPPVGTRFIVTQNVELDLREQVHEYVAGHSRKGAKLTVQFVVRGHRRWQACGPQHTERKLIWISPYWKGPEEGRALVRGYELRDTKVTE